MNSDQIREAFLRFFEDRGHKIVPSSSLIPQGDPSLLFVNAGMVQFKDVFLGLDKRPYTRAATAQKCVRAGGKHNDLDMVGRTARHHTFFEMLGNFSFGDYFKKEAIAYAWEFLTQVLRLPEERLWITVYQQDEEAFGLWQEIAGVLPERIVRLGEKDNFWSMGETGPCGPCSEIVFDRGEEHRCEAPICAIGQCDCDRWCELWNLVFMEYNRNASGQLTSLERTGVDTGMGLERIASVVQGVPTNFETDLLRPIVDKVVEVSGQPYYSDERGFPHRVIGDHARACAFIIADGLLPSNEGRGYVLRRILRRAALYGRKLGLERPLLADVAEAVIARMGQAYPELVKNGEFISRVIGLEEERFDQTLDVGLNLLDGLMVEVKGATVIPGDVVFRLYDTYGFPPEITEEVAAEKGLGIDRAGFDAAMAEQRERSRTAQISASGTLGMSGEVTIEVKRAGAVYEELGLPPNPFVGYETLSHSSVVVGLVVGGERVEAISQGQEAEVILLETPFYGEMGGQVGDAGEIRGPSGRFRVRDTVYALPGLAVHRGMMEEGELETGEIVQAEVDKERRLDIARNHTATHLLHAALRQILGSHVRQAGSLVAPDRLRFDFSHMAAVTPDELQQIQRWVNDKIRRNLPVRSEVKSYSQALAEGALAFFGEKYGDEVRMMAIGKDTQVSAELCGGTHLSATGEIGFLQIVSEGSIGANMRRIEAVTGRGAEAWLEERLSLLEKVSQQLKTTPAEVEGKVVNLASELEKETKKSAAMERELLRHRAEPLLSQVESIDGVTFLAGALPAATMEALRETGDWLRDQLRGGFVLLGSVYNDRPNFVAMAAANVVAKGIHAGEIVKQVAAVVGGGGGGTPQLGQGSGRDKAKLKEALERGRELVRHQLRASSGG